MRGIWPQGSCWSHWRILMLIWLPLYPAKHDMTLPCYFILLFQVLLVLWFLSKLNRKWGNEDKRITIFFTLLIVVIFCCFILLAITIASVHNSCSKKVRSSLPFVTMPWFLYHLMTLLLLFITKIWKSKSVLKRSALYHFCLFWRLWSTGANYMLKFGTNLCLLGGLIGSMLLHDSWLIN